MAHNNMACGGAESSSRTMLLHPWDIERPKSSYGFIGAFFFTHCIAAASLYMGGTCGIFLFLAGQSTPIIPNIVNGYQTDGAPAADIISEYHVFPWDVILCYTRIENLCL